MTPGEDTPCPRCGTLIMEELLEPHLAGHLAIDQAEAETALVPATATPEVLPAIDITKPVDWLAAIEAIAPYTHDPGVYDDPPWEAFMRHQLERAMWYLMERLHATATSDLKVVTRRTAIILNAEPEAPSLERNLGIRLAVQFEGEEVKCRVAKCRLRYTCQPEDPYFDATTRANGICTRCMLAETRSDAAVALVEVEGKVVPKRKAVTR